MNVKAFLGVALVADVIAIAAVLIAGNGDVGPLNELALVLASGLAGAALPRTPA